MWLESRVAGRGLIVLALETSCDDTCAAVTDDARILSNVISSQAAAHARYGGVVPEVASRHHLELINPVVDAALGEAGVELDGRRRDRRHPGPGLIGALLVGVATAKALAAPLRKPLVGVEPPSRPRRRELPRAGPARAAVPLPDRERRPHAARGRHATTRASRSWARRSTTPRARHSTRAPGCSGLGYPGGPAIQGEAEGGDPAAFDFPVAMTRDPGLDFSFSGLKTALLYAVAAWARASSNGVARTSRRATRPRSSASWSRSSSEPSVDGDWEAVALGGGRGGEHAAAGADRRALRGARAAAEAGSGRALHRQRGDDRVRGAVRGARAVSGVPGVDGDGMKVVALHPRPGAISATRPGEDRRAPRFDRRIRAPGDRHRYRRRAATRGSSSAYPWWRWTGRSSRELDIDRAALDAALASAGPILSGR